MVVSWEGIITPIDILKKIVKIVATRTETDDTDPLNLVVVSVHTVSMESAAISTAANKLEAANILWAKYQKKIAKETQVANLIGALEAQLKIDLEGREP